MGSAQHWSRSTRLFARPSELCFGPTIRRICLPALPDNNRKIIPTPGVAPNYRPRSHDDAGLLQCFMGSTVTNHISWIAVAGC